MTQATVALIFAAVLFATAAEAQYDSSVAMDALYYCKAAYCDASAIADWSCAACSDHPSFTNVNVYHNTSIDSQGFSGYDANSNTIIVAFRGSSNIPNWFNNLDFIKTPYPVAACGCEVHQGFWQEYLSMSASVLQDVAALVQSYPSAGIVVTGHSLGAAVSIFAALDIANQISPSGVTVYNFGQPRVGDPAFAGYAASVLPLHKQFRVTHSRDPVPHLPLEIMGFLHTPHELWYDNDGSASWSDCNDSPTAEDPNCSDSVIPDTIDDHLLYLGVCTECSCSENARSGQKWKSQLGRMVGDAQRGLMQKAKGFMGGNAKARRSV